ncbi:hypothetical protein FQA39_LY13376 [Lamprigera yunnana]|nr:hypothetical protein FQA39_LY13376 [Lamprigera yunnana]
MFSFSYLLNMNKVWYIILFVNSSTTQRKTRQDVDIRTNQEELMKSVTELHVMFNKLIDMMTDAANVTSSEREDTSDDSNVDLRVNKLNLFPINIGDKKDAVELKLLDKDFHVLFVSIYLHTVLEVLLFMLEEVLLGVDLEKNIREKVSKRVKMWMPYAEPYWTKAVDLRSTVEKLDEELSGLEFDANHEAVYGLEKKICIKFLQEIYCASYLIVHLKKAGLKQFVDRIKEYIEDYSYSDASSDDGCEEGDNKHANTAKEEEEEKKE